VATVLDTVDIPPWGPVPVELALPILRQQTALAEKISADVDSYLASHGVQTKQCAVCWWGGNARVGDNEDIIDLGQIRCTRYAGHVHDAYDHGAHYPFPAESHPKFDGSRP